MTNSTCPEAHELTPLLAGEPLPPDIQSHVQACDACRKRLGEMHTQLEQLRTALPAHPPTEVAPARPATIGKYLVVGELDSGAQAVVYRAVHPTLDRELAIKLSRTPMSADADSRPLLIAEGKVLAQLDHPHLARVYDLDFHDSAPFLAMEYVRGRNLQKHYAGKPVPARQAAEWTAKLARALEQVHKHGIVHQDIKPGNIVVDLEDEPRLLDFGLARLRHVWDSDNPPPSGGTLSYMAPEQALGQVNRIGPTTDLFGMGAVLYFLLTGKAPYGGQTTDEIRDRASRAEFDRDALTGPGVPRRLAAVCLKAMAAEPADRYGSAGEMAEALERFIRPRPKRVGMMLALAASLLIIAGIAWRIWPTAEPAVTIPVVPVVPGKTEQVVGLQVQVARQGKYLDLLSALPLSSNKDSVQIVGKAPAGWHVALFHFSPKGKAKRLDVETSPADQFTRVVYPGRGTQSSLEAVEGGTEFVLLCASPRRETLDQIEETMESVLGSLPVLPGNVVIHLNRDEPTRQTTHSLGTRHVDPVAQVEFRLDQLRIRLREEVALIQGVAFSHRP